MQGIVAAVVMIACISQAGRASELADLVNNFAPIWLFIGIIALVVGLSFDRRSLFLWAAGGLLLICAADILGPEILQKAIGHVSAERRPQLRIIQFNIFKQNRSLDQAVSWIVAQNADVVVLEEALKNARALGRLKAQFPYGVSCLSAMRCSTIILSRQRPIASGGFARGDPENRKAVSVAWASFGDPTRRFTVIGVHYQHPWPFGDQASAQSAVAWALSRIDRKTAIVAGDFNLAPWTFAMKRQDRAFAIPRLTRAVVSWPSPVPMLPIDHVYAGERWSLSGIQRGPSSGSDHYPLLLTLSFRS